jgi:putative oxidoreductase
MMFGLSLGLLILRLVLGLTVAAHGAQKLFGWFDGPGLGGFGQVMERLNIRPAGPFALLAGLAEFAGGLLVALGFLNPIGPLTVAGAMVVAIVTVHVGKGFFNTGGGYEFPLVILGGALALSLTGPGAYSLDGLLRLSLPEPGTWILFALVSAIGAVAALGSRRAGQRRMELR